MVGFTLRKLLNHIHGLKKKIYRNGKQFFSPLKHKGQCKQGQNSSVGSMLDLIPRWNWGVGTTCCRAVRVRAFFPGVNTGSDCIPTPVLKMRQTEVQCINGCITYCAHITSHHHPVLEKATVADGVDDMNTCTMQSEKRTVWMKTISARQDNFLFSHPEESIEIELVWNSKLWWDQSVL